MESNELRIGNYIKHTESNRVGAVTGLQENIIDCTNGFDGSLYSEPIPLTEEWLLKFGFEKKTELLGFGSVESTFYELNNDRIYLLRKGFEYERTPTLKSNERFNLCKVYNYVHQLQNLYFALKGEELECR